MTNFVCEVRCESRAAWSGQTRSGKNRVSRVGISGPVTAIRYFSVAFRFTVAAAALQHLLHLSQRPRAVAEKRVPARLRN